MWDERTAVFKGFHIHKNDHKIWSISQDRQLWFDTHPEFLKSYAQYGTSLQDKIFAYLMALLRPSFLPLTYWAQAQSSKDPISFSHLCAVYIRTYVYTKVHISSTYGVSKKRKNLVKQNNTTIFSREHICISKESICTYT